MEYDMDIAYGVIKRGWETPVASRHRGLIFAGKIIELDQVFPDSHWVEKVEQF